MTKTIITRDLIPEEPGSRFPKVNITQPEAQKICETMGGRLPTSDEYERAFAIDPWPHLAYGWTSTEAKLSGFVVRGGAWFNRPSNARASFRNRNVPARRYFNVGFRCAKDIADDAEAPTGWIELPPV